MEVDRMMKVFALNHPMRTVAKSKRAFKVLGIAYWCCLLLRTAIDGLEEEYKDDDNENIENNNGTLL